MIENKRGRTVTKRHFRKREMSPDPFYRNKNFNKPHRFDSRIAPFTWVTRCKYINSVHEQKQVTLKLNEAKKEFM